MTNKAIKTIGVRAVVFMMMTSCLGMRWIPVAGSIGPAAIILWLIAALAFFVPLALIVIELSLNYPENGGISLWTRKGLGKRAGFYAAWFYWVNNVVYYPGALTFIAVNVVYLIGDHSLAENSGVIVAIVIACFWAAVWLNISGIHYVSKVTTLSGLFNFRLGLFFILVGCYYVISYGHSATSFSPDQFIPQRDMFRSISDISVLMFALAGVEIIPTVGRAIKNPEKNLTKAIIIGGVLLVSLYILGTIAINFIMTPHELTQTTGLVASFYTLTAKLHWSNWVVSFLVVSLIFVEFGGLNLWLIASSITFFEGTEKGILPEWLQSINKNYVPANALIFQGVMVTVIVMATKFMPTVNAMYMVLILMATIIYFIPYLFLVIAYLKLRHNNALVKKILTNRMAKLMAFLTFTSVLMAIILTIIPSADIVKRSDIVLYELELIGGPLLFYLSGVIIYSRRKLTSFIKR
ncbi:MAG: amino acid permease [Neisseriaceae bacterium]|nr:MAG: amino acid permease [Neisseriaceae bacterium]